MRMGVWSLVAHSIVRTVDAIPGSLDTTRLPSPFGYPARSSFARRTASFP
jgi:hypothetical protein